jgi:hypothetical protein
MGATAEIRGLCDQSAQSLRNALLAYAKGSRRAAESVRADALLYGDLIRHYLLWSADLLISMEEAASARPACKPAVDSLLESANAYFQNPVRWPGSPQITHPLRLLIPAYYTVRAVQEVNSRLRPNLLLMELEEAHEVVVDILGHAVTDKVCYHKNSDLESIPKVEDGGGSEPRRYRAFLHAAQRKRLAKARAAKPVPPTVAPSPQPAPAPAEAIEKEKLAALTWSRDLSDSRIVLEQINELYGPGSYYSREVFLDLFSGDRYRLLERTTCQVSSGGLNVGRPTTRESGGEWRIEPIASAARLLLNDDGGGSTFYRLEKGGRNCLIVDGRDRAWQPM